MEHCQPHAIYVHVSSGFLFTCYRSGIHSSTSAIPAAAASDSHRNVSFGRESPKFAGHTFYCCPVRVILSPFPIMAVFSLHSKLVEERAAQFSKLYTIHRPLLQRCLNVGLAFYALGSTYRGLSSRPASPQSTKKSKGKGKDDAIRETRTGKPPRVAVRHLKYFHTPASSLQHASSGRCCVLSTTVSNPSDCHS